MTDRKLIEWYNSRRDTYDELIDSSGSISELTLKLEVYGSKWTKWDWVIFLSYLDFETVCAEREMWSNTFGEQDDRDTPERRLINDVFDELDSGTGLDAVLTNKTVLVNLISWISTPGWRNIPRRKYGMLRLLSHVFRKFPRLWTMNWMYVRHRRGSLVGTKTHRLAFALPSVSSRPPRYFDSDAFREDFISRFWGENGTYFEESQI